MYVIKRTGKKELVNLNKITKRLKNLAEKEPKLMNIDAIILSQKVIQGIYNGVRTTDLDILAAETSAYMSTIHPDYETLAARIAVSNMHKETSKNYLDVIVKMYANKTPTSGDPAPLISQECYEIIVTNIGRIQKVLNYDRDYGYDYFGYKTLERSYLTKIIVNGKLMLLERPQHLLMRVAVGIHKNNIDKVIECYNLMSQRYYTHATPTLFNAATNKAQMSSCFLLTMTSDSINGIYTTLKNCALISKTSGGIGLSVHSIRASGSYISQGGMSNGIIPMLRVFNDTARYVDQGGGKRKGAFAIYVEPWHADIIDFLNLKKNTGKEEQRCRDLFFGLWIPDLFMKRVETDKNWSLFCPNECKGLQDVYGDQFEQLYDKYEREGKARKVIRARDLWFQIIDSQIETGTPYMLYKDACNEKSNQKNLGTIKCSNLCCEIVEYTSADEVAVCNLASISLKMFVDEKEKKFDHKKLYEITYHITENLNKIIDENYYPIPETKYSNLKNRPIGIGVQGLADTFFKLKYPFDSDEAKSLNIEIFETMYYAAARASCDIAKKEGPYSSFNGSPASQGILSPDMWINKPVTHSGRWDYDLLRNDVKEYGMRNSLLIALMPTASTSQILGNNECIEPVTSNIYTRRVLAGEFTIINKYLLKDLLDMGIWSNELKNEIIAKGGSIQDINMIPNNIKKLYRTVWELKMKDLVDMSAARAPYIDQSQSLNAFIETPTKAKLTSMHFYSWKSGLKTGMYYLRTRPAADPIQFTVDKSKLDTANELSHNVCELENGCVMCGS